MKRNATLLVALSVITIAGLIIKANPVELADELSEASPTYLMLAVGVYILTTLLKMTRWHLLLKCTGNRIKFTKTSLFFLMGLSLNSVMPGGISGEPVRLYFLKKEKGVSVGQGIATIFAERFMDITVLISFALFSLLFIFPLMSHNDFYHLLFPVLFVALLLFFVAYSIHSPTFMDRMLNFFLRAFNTLLPIKTARAKMEGMVKMFRMGIRDIAASGKEGTLFFALSYIIWLLSTLRIYILLRAIDIEVSIFAVFLTSSITYIFGVLLPGGAGNIVAIAGVFSAVGVSFDTAAAVGVLEVATSLFISVPTGLVSMAITGLKIESTFADNTAGLKNTGTDKENKKDSEKTKIESSKENIVLEPEP